MCPGARDCPEQVEGGLQDLGAPSQLLGEVEMQANAAGGGGPCAQNRKQSQEVKGGGGGFNQPGATKSEQMGGISKPGSGVQYIQVLRGPHFPALLLLLLMLL